MCSLVGSSCAEGSRRTTSTTTPKCGPTIEEQGQLAGGCARSGRSVYGWVENNLLSMQTRARAHALSTSYELLLLVERLDVHRDGSLSTTRLSNIKEKGEFPKRNHTFTRSFLAELETSPSFYCKLHYPPDPNPLSSCVTQAHVCS